MNSPKFSLGMMIGALTFAFVMSNLWLWGIVPVDAMNRFDRNPHDQFMIVGIAFAAMFVGGFLCAVFDHRKKK